MTVILLKVKLPWSLMTNKIRTLVLETLKVLAELAFPFCPSPHICFLFVCFLIYIFFWFCSYRLTIWYRWNSAPLIAQRTWNKENSSDPQFTWFLIFNCDLIVGLKRIWKLPLTCPSSAATDRHLLFPKRSSIPPLFCLFCFLWNLRVRCRHNVY